jgi:hypothetical protein
MGGVGRGRKAAGHPQPVLEGWIEASFHELHAQMPVAPGGRQLGESVVQRLVVVRRHHLVAHGPHGGYHVQPETFVLHG